MVYGEWLHADGVSEILDIYPPFLFIDRARLFRSDCNSGAEAEYDVNRDHWIFKSHMRRQPVFPGALVGEFLCQTAMIDLYSKLDAYESRGLLRAVNFTFINKVACEQGPVRLSSIANLSSFNRGISIYSVHVDDYISGKRIAQGHISHALPIFSRAKLNEKLD